jgi:uncharacterized membrane protein YhiD involved in acid resistance
MDELIRESLRDFNTIGHVSMLQFFFALSLTFILMVVLSKSYTVTHSGYSYSKSFVQSMVFVGITITLIMIIIGSNIARAFALVGAMSIIRFRNPVKDSRDIVFIFMAMAIGMACGTQFYLYAVIFTLFIVAINYIFQIYRFGETSNQSYILKINMSKGGRDEAASIFEKYCVRISLVSIDRLSGVQDFEEVIYEIDLKKKEKYEKLLSDLTSSSNINSVNLLVGESNVNV